METEKNRGQGEAPREEDRSEEGSMTERGLGEAEAEREKAREERGREYDIARRQMPIHR